MNGTLSFSSFLYELLPCSQEAQAQSDLRGQGTAEARASWGVSTGETKSPLDSGSSGARETSWHYLCTEGPLTPTLTADKARKAPKLLASWPAKPLASLQSLPPPLPHGNSSQETAPKPHGGP